MPGSLCQDHLMVHLNAEMKFEESKKEVTHDVQLMLSLQSARGFLISTGHGVMHLAVEFFGESN